MANASKLSWGVSLFTTIACPKSLRFISRNYFLHVCFISSSCLKHLCTPFHVFVSNLTELTSFWFLSTSMLFQSIFILSQEIIHSIHFFYLKKLFMASLHTCSFVLVRNMMSIMNGKGSHRGSLDFIRSIFFHFKLRIIVQHGSSRF